MTNKDKRPTPPVAPKAIEGAGKAGSQKSDQGMPDTAEKRGQQTDRPGFDLGGSSGDTHAGTGLGLGEDAFDTPGERRLPGRRLHNKLTIPRWSGPEPRDTTTSEKKTQKGKTGPIPPTQKDA